jgi:hypothetical protein
MLRVIRPEAGEEPKALRLVEGHQKSKTFVFLSFSPVGFHEIEGRLKPPFSLPGF